MKSILAGIFALLVATTLADAKGGGSSGGFHFTAPHSATNGSVHYTKPYVRSDGTYVQGHYSTNPTGTRNDNFSTQGNVNPYTGEPGTKPRDGQ